MPWECKQCGAEAADTLLDCPGCNASKTAWTLLDAQTRTFVVSQPRIKLLVGQRAAPVPSDPAERPELELSDAEQVPVVTKAAARELADGGLHPAPADTLWVRLHPQGHADSTIALAVLYGGEPAEDRALPQETPASLGTEGFFDVQLLFVYGTDDTSGVVFPDVTLVDISEDFERGYAPSVEFSAFGRHSVELPTRDPAEVFELEVVDDGEPRAQERYTLVLDGKTTIDGETDDAGVVGPHVLPPETQEAELTFEGDDTSVLFRIGQLAPLEDVTGIQARLENLGYAPGAIDGDHGLLTSAALRAFQAAQDGLSVTGELDSATRDRIQAAHGG